MMMTWCVVLLKRHSSIVRLPGRYVQARSAIPSSTLSSQGVARGKLSCPRHDTWVNLLTISWSEAPPDTVLRPMPPMRDDPVVGPKPGQTPTTRRSGCCAVLSTSRPGGRGLRPRRGQFRELPWCYLCASCRSAHDPRTRE